MSYSWYDLVGNLGVAVIVGTYALLQLGHMSARGLTYSLANGLGAALVLWSLAYEFNLSAFIVELFWVLISLYGVVRALRHPA